MMKITPIKQNFTYKKSESFKEKNSSIAMRNSNKTSDKQIEKHKLLNYLFPLGLVIASGIGIKCFHNKKVNQDNIIKNEMSDYVIELAKSLSENLNKHVEATSLKSIISGKELLAELKKLEKQNFIATTENIEKGIFCADLHSHSLYSDGLGKVENILNQVADYADNLNKKNGKKFLFSLTDHDSCEGAKEALKIISENPEKFKNVKFIVASELSYLIKSDKTGNPFETSEILVYGFNPFESKVQNYFKNLYSKRENMIKNYIDELNKMFGYADFSVEEFNATYGKNYMMNYQWKVHHYGQTKNAIAGYANSLGKDKNLMYKEIMKQTDPNKKMLHNLREKGLVPASYGDDTRITDICKNKYTPRMLNGKINYVAEVNFDDIIQTFGQDKNIFGAFAHPYYVTEKNSQADILLKNLVSMSKGFIKATESYHQAYQPNIKIDNIENFNKNLVKENLLLELGGYDNHEINWLNR